MKIITAAMLALIGVAHADATWEAEKACLEGRYGGTYDARVSACGGVDLGIDERALTSGINAWHHAYDERDSREIVRAAILLDSDIPLYKFLVEANLEDDLAQRLQLLLLAKTLGADRQRNAKGESYADYYLALYTPEERAQGEVALAELVKTVSLDVEPAIAPTDAGGDVPVPPRL